MVDILTGKELLLYPKGAQFLNKMLKNIEISIQSQSTNYDMGVLNHFEANGYLSQLILISYGLNNEFHDTMYDILIKMIENSDTCLNTMVRCKNTLKIVKLHRYGDIEYNVSLQSPQLKSSIVAECMFVCLFCIIRLLTQRKKIHQKTIQFLLNFMKVSKSLGHYIYEIELRSDFINNLSEIFDLSKNKYEKLLFNIISSSGSSSIKISPVLLAYFDEIDLSIFDKSGTSSIHYVCNNTLTLSLECVLDDDSSNDKLKELINLRTSATYGMTPLFSPCPNGSNECIKTLLEYPEIEVNVAFSNSHGMIAASVRNDSLCKGIDSNDPLLLAIETGSVDFSREVLGHKEISFNRGAYDDEKNDQIIAGVFSDKPPAEETFNMVLKDDLCDVRSMTPITKCIALTFSASTKNCPLINTLVNTNKFHNCNIMQ